MNKIHSLIIMTLFATLITVSGVAPAAARDGVSTFHQRNSTETLIRLYEDPGRQEWQRPQQVIDRLSVRPGDVVADIGAGTGYFSVLFAEKTGKSGTVYAVDIDRNMVEYVEQRAKREGLPNIRSILAKADDPALAKDSVDLIFICNTYMFIADRDLYLARLRNALKQNGRLAIVSYNQVDSPEGPPIHTRISREKTVREVLEAGFVLDTEHFFLPYQHFLVFIKR